METMSTGVGPFRSIGHQNGFRVARGDLLFDFGNKAASETSLVMLQAQVWPLSRQRIALMVFSWNGPDVNSFTVSSCPLR